MEVFLLQGHNLLLLALAYILGVFLSFPGPGRSVTLPVLLYFSCTHVTLSKLPLSGEMA